ncbi:AsmA family protein (plasmid) [Staphylococcus epidermidis]|nr:AsmA family protein [Staphylococcus epidermidis]
MKRKYKITGIIFIVLLIVLTLIFSIVHHYANVQKT